MSDSNQVFGISEKTRRMSVKKFVGVVAALLLSTACAKGQEAKSEQPKTKIEAFEAQVGSVIVRGFSEMGTIQGELGTTISIESREFMNAATGKKEYGIGIEVAEGGRLERKNSSYIDYDEIEPLIKGIDYIAKITKDVTPMENFQADYRTRGDFRASTYSNGGTVSAAVASGTIGGARAFLSLPELGKLRELLVGAKQKLDSVKTAG